MYVANYCASGFRSEHARELGGKGSDCHHAAVIGDTVGDPLKDTSGPSLNILIKLMAVESLVFAPFFASCGNGDGYIFHFFSPTASADLICWDGGPRVLLPTWTWLLPQIYIACRHFIQLFLHSFWNVHLSIVLSEPWYMCAAWYGKQCFLFQN